MTPAWMPPLPEPEEYDSPGAFSHDQMHAYALAAVKAYKANLRPVMTVPVLGNLYALDDQP